MIVPGANEVRPIAQGGKEMAGRHRVTRSNLSGYEDPPTQEELAPRQGARFGCDRKETERPVLGMHEREAARAAE